MMSPQSLTRRLVPALAVTVVSTLVFGALVVTADVADGTEALLPETFAVAAPKQGDAWRYNVTLSGDWTFGLDDEVKLDTPTPFGTFQWAGQAKVRGGDGFLHDVNRFQATHLVYEPLWLDEVDEDLEDEIEDGATGGQGDNSTHAHDTYTCIEETYDDEDPEEEVACSAAESPYWNEVENGAWVLAGGRSIVSRGFQQSYNESYTDYGIPMTPGVMAEWHDMYQEYAFVEYPVDEVPCLVYNPLQLGNVSLAGGIGLFDACSLGGRFLAIPDGLVFYAKEVEEVAGVQAVRFEASQNGTYAAWFTPAVPYPVRIAFDLPSERPEELELGDRDLPGARSAVLEMTGFAAGTQPLPSVDDPTEPAPAFANAAPMTIASTANPVDPSLGQTVTFRGGPDEAGFAHPFPLSEALLVAAEDTQWADLRTYLGNHQDAYVAFASYMEGDDVYYAPQSGAVPGYAYVWSVGMTDGGETLAFTVAKETHERALPVALREAAPENASQPTYHVEQGGYYQPYYDPYHDGSGAWETAPYPSRLPAEMPTVQSIADRWAAFDGSGTPFNSYGFAYSCVPLADDSDACEVRLDIQAGHVRYSYGTAGTPFFPMAVPGNPYGTEVSVQSERLVSFDGEGVASSLLVFDDRQYRSSGGPSIGNPGDRLPVPDPPADPGYDVQSTQISGIPSSSMSWVPQGKEAASIGFMGIVVGALYWVWPKLGVVGLFSRLHRGELLDHPARAKLVQIVESQPGIHFHDLAQKAELANGTAVHHLRKLSDSGHLNVRRSGRYTCYFPGGRVDPHTAAAAPLLKSGGAKQVLEAVRNKPGMSNLELAQATGLQPSTVNYHVQRLAAAGLVAALRDGRNVRLHPGVRAGSADPTPAAAA